ncbi:unnamed protein product [Lactuca saligna]|uniref:DUF3741 domain-containing protein n=1 Tax=Lactuca saligna TaxID=75948 RepID=A0AA35YQA5_LACSI|nr:unnamed protein product [Lactuca saligna]
MNWLVGWLVGWLVIVISVIPCKHLVKPPPSLPLYSVSCDCLNVFPTNVSIYISTVNNTTCTSLHCVMKDLSFLGLHNSLGLKMNKGLKNLCTGDTSTSTLKQQKSPPMAGGNSQQQATLEEMIMRLDLEEKMAARAKLQEEHRMSCVNSSDILRCARNALNQYPRFSLDGKDAMYRSSFRNPTSVAVDLRSCLPAKVAGERVIWCTPGPVGRLMGLDAMPIPVRLKLNRRINSCCILRNHKNLRKTCFHHHLPLPLGLASSSTAAGCSVMKPM